MNLNPIELMQEHARYGTKRNSNIKFSINYKQFKGEFFKSICNGLMDEYSKIYNKDDLNIEYKPIMHEYRFIIFINMNVINNIDKNIKQVKTILAIYDNIEAIEFSSIPEKEYYIEYDDSKKDYLQELRDDVNALIPMYILQGLKIDIDNDIKIEKDGISIRLQYSINQPKCYIIKNKIPKYKGMLTKDEKRILLNSIKRGLERSIKVL